MFSKYIPLHPKTSSPTLSPLRNQKDRSPLVRNKNLPKSYDREAFSSKTSLRINHSSPRPRPAYGIEQTITSTSESKIFPNLTVNTDLLNVYCLDSILSIILLSAYYLISCRSIIAHSSQKTRFLKFFQTGICCGPFQVAEFLKPGTGNPIMSFKIFR